MGIAKILYWLIFTCITLCSFYLQYKERQTLGIAILLLLGSFHIIVFHFAEDSFVEIRFKIREGVELIIEGISVVTISILAILIVSVMALFFLFGKMFKEPRKLFKTFQRL